MNLPLNIARRYFFSKEKKQFINIISIISMIVVMVGTMALIIALSVFNGLEDIIRSLHSTFNPNLKITALKGKSFEVPPNLLGTLEEIPGIEVITEVIEDNALLKYKDKQMVVVLKGVSDNFLEESKMDSTLLRGEFKLKDGNKNLAVIGRGVQIIMGISIRNDFDVLQLWYPKKSKKINLSNISPEKSFNRSVAFPVGVFTLEKSYDEKYIFVPLRFMQKLLEYKDKRTALEVKVQKGYAIATVQSKLKKLLGKDFKVKNSEEQEAGLLRAIKIEKLFVYLTLSFILAVASFNIFFSLMMLVIDKKKDIAILQAIGAPTRVIRRIFLSEGILIAFTGAFSGLILGTIICVLQQKYGLVSMGTESTIITAYPVKLKLEDFFYTGITIIVITAISSYIPAINATKIDVKENV